MEHAAVVLCYMTHSYRASLEVRTKVCSQLGVIFGIIRRLLEKRIIG